MYTDKRFALSQRREGWKVKISLFDLLFWFLIFNKTILNTSLKVLLFKGTISKIPIGENIFSDWKGCARSWSTRMENQSETDFKELILCLWCECESHFYCSGSILLPHLHREAVEAQPGRPARGCQPTNPPNPKKLTLAAARAPREHGRGVEQMDALMLQPLLRSWSSWPPHGLLLPGLRALPAHPMAGTVGATMACTTLHS